MPTDVLTKRIAWLRARLRGWLAIRGAALLAATLTGLVFGSLLFDRLARLDRAQRTVMLGLMTGALLYVAVRFLVLPLLRSFSDDGLCLQVEERNPELNAVLISALQIDRRSAADSAGVSANLAEATVRAGEEAAKALDFEALINRRGRRRNFTLLFAAVGLLGGAALVFPSTLSLWFQRNVFLLEVSWPRDTTLVIQDLEDGRLGVPEGDDLTLRVEADPDGVVPRKVSVRSRPVGRGGRGETRTMARIGDNLFRLTYESVRTPFKLRVSGNDHRTAWVFVDPLERPEIADLRFVVYPPAYTGVAERDLDVGQSAYQILEGSSMTLTGTARKPLREVSLSLGGDLIRTVPLQGEREFSVTLEPAEIQGGQYALQVLDVQGVDLENAVRFGVRLRKDRTPDVRLSTDGMGALALAGAVLPVQISIEDDYDITDVRLVCTVVAEEADERVEPLEVPGIEPIVSSVAGEIRHEGRVELSPLGLRPGSELMVRLEADDNDTLGGPKTGSSSTIGLSVVTPEELAQQFLRREQELHQRFSRMVRDQTKLNEDAEIAAARLRNADPDAAAEARSLDLLERDQRKMGGRLKDVAEQFEGMIAELRNNRLEPRGGPTQTRWQTEIIAPVSQLVDPWVPRAVQHIREARRATETAPSQAALDRAKNAQNEILRRMRRVEANMAKAETLQEAISMLRRILGKQRELREQTEEKRGDFEESVFE